MHVIVVMRSDIRSYAYLLKKISLIRWVSSLFRSVNWENFETFEPMNALDTWAELWVRGGAGLDIAEVRARCNLATDCVWIMFCSADSHACQFKACHRYERIKVELFDSDKTAHVCLRKAQVSRSLAWPQGSKLGGQCLASETVRRMQTGRFEATCLVCYFLKWQGSQQAVRLGR